MRNITQIQQFLVSQQIDIGPQGVDGRFGFGTLNGVNFYLKRKGRAPFRGVPTLVEVNEALFPEEQPAPKPKPPNLFEQIGTITSLINLLKGKTMTADQITGVVRAILAAVSGFFIAKGAGDADLWNWVIAGVTGIVPVVWTWINNRPKTIKPMGQ